MVKKLKKKTRPPKLAAKKTALAARAKSKGAGKTSTRDRNDQTGRKILRWSVRGALAVAAVIVAAILFFSIVNPRMTPYMMSEDHRLGGISRTWVSMDKISPYVARAVVAAEDANFCNHWGFDMAEIRKAMQEGRKRGASTLTQQTVKNVFLWQGRSWLRKALESIMTPLVEIFWSKKRIVEVYLNVAEFDEGVFGIDAAAHHYFGVGPDKLRAVQAARLAAVLPNPKKRSASRPTSRLRKRAAQIVQGAATIRVDGRAACFED